MIEKVIMQCSEVPRSCQTMLMVARVSLMIAKVTKVCSGVPKGCHATLKVLKLTRVLLRVPESYQGVPRGSHRSHLSMQGYAQSPKSYHNKLLWFPRVPRVCPGVPRVQSRVA